MKETTESYSFNFYFLYLENGIWFRADPILTDDGRSWSALDQQKNDLFDRADFDKLVRKAISNISGTWSETWFVGWKRHRLDGPARTEIHNNQTRYSWFVNDEYLMNFNPSSLLPNQIYIFEYVQKYKYFINEILELSIHNKWLNENQALILKTLKTFK